MQPEEIKKIGNFPSDLINPSLKGKEWCRQFNEAIYWEWTNGRGSFKQERRNDWILNRLYGEGNQPNDKYIKAYTETSKEGNQEGFMNLDLSIIPILAKFKDAVMGYLSKFGHDLAIDAQDELSANEKETYKWRIWAEKQLAGKFQEIEQKAGRKLDEYQPPFIPESKEELEIFMENNGLKLPEEVSFEEAIAFVLYVNDWIQVEMKALEDFYECSVAGTRVYKDLRGRVKVRYVDPVNLLASTTKRKDFKNIRYIGELVTMTIGELKMDAGSQFTEEEYMNIANQFAGRIGNPQSIFSMPYINTDETYSYQWDNYNITVLDAQFRTVDRIYTEKTTLANRGKVQIERKPYGHTTGNKDKKVNLTDLDVIYGCKSIVGTKYCYDTGKVQDIYRPVDDLSDADFDFTIYKVSNKAVLERQLPFADAIQLTWLKLQNLKAKARPSGVSIDTAALENVALGAAVLKPHQIIQLFEQTGNLLWSSNGSHYKDLQQSGSSSKPIEELRGGLGTEYTELTGDMKNNILWIQQVSGLNDTMDASNVDPNNPVGTSKLAQMASHNTLKPILDGVQKLKEETYKKIACKLQLTSRFGGLEKYKQAIGSGKIKYIEIFSQKSLASYGLKVVPQPTEEMKGQIQTATLEAMKQRAMSGKGGIDFPDYLFVMRIVNGGNLKLAEALLSHRITKKIEYDNAVAERLSAVNAQASAEAGIAVKKAEMEKDQAMTMNKIMLEKATHTMKLIQDNNTSMNTMKEKAFESGLNIQEIKAEFEEKEKQLLLQLEADFQLAKYQVDNAPAPAKAA